MPVSKVDWFITKLPFLYAFFILPFTLCQPFQLAYSSGVRVITAVTLLSFRTPSGCPSPVPLKMAISIAFTIASVAIGTNKSVNIFSVTTFAKMLWEILHSKP